MATKNTPLPTLAPIILPPGVVICRGTNVHAGATLAGPMGNGTATISVQGTYTADGTTHAWLTPPSIADQVFGSELDVSALPDGWTYHTNPHFDGETTGLESAPEPEPPPAPEPPKGKTR